MKAKLQGIKVVKLVDGTFLGLTYSKERLDDGGFACACPADNAHFLTRLNGNVDSP